MFAVLRNRTSFSRVRSIKPLPVFLSGLQSPLNQAGKALYRATPIINWERKADLSVCTLLITLKRKKQPQSRLGVSPFLLALTAVVSFAMRLFLCCCFCFHAGLRAFTSVKGCPFRLYQSLWSCCQPSDRLCHLRRQICQAHFSSFFLFSESSFFNPCGQFFPYLHIAHFRDRKHLARYQRHGVAFYLRHIIAVNAKAPVDTVKVRGKLPL